jgi:hypothetical protein
LPLQRFAVRLQIERSPLLIIVPTLMRFAAVERLSTGSVATLLA